MDEKIIPLLEVIDEQKLTEANKKLVDGIFQKNVIDSALQLNLITEKVEAYALNIDGYKLLNNAKARKETKTANRNALTVSVLALIVAISSLIIVILR